MAPGYPSRPRQARTSNPKPQTPNSEPRTPNRKRRLRGTAALQTNTDHRYHQRMAIVGQFPGTGGRPLRRRRVKRLLLHSMESPKWKPISYLKARVLKVDQVE